VQPKMWLAFFHLNWSRGQPLLFDREKENCP
jgi:hypothetical protein